MRLSFSQLEQARKNPRKFGQSYKPGAINFSSKNFRTYLFAAIKRFHNGGSKEEVLQFFLEKSKEKLEGQNHFQARLTHYTKILDSYCDTFPDQGCRVIETGKRTSLKIRDHVLSGKIERLDLRLASGYRATTTQLNKADWENELRWPLVQKAIAQELACSTAEVEVGVFCFEDGKYGYRTFSNEEILAAENEAEHVLTEVERNVSTI
jgi:hypothetical protein